MPSENVVRDRRKKARIAKTARVSGSGYERGLAPDFDYGEDEPSILPDYGTEEDRPTFDEKYFSGDWVSSGSRKDFRDKWRMERRIFELMRQQGKRFNYDEGSDMVMPAGITRRTARIAEGLRENHPDVRNPYQTTEQYHRKKRTSEKDKSIQQFIGELLNR